MPLKLELDPSAKVAPYRQILDQVRAAILSCAVSAGEQLPSVREMAAALSVNPLTVARALNELESAGLIESRWGKGNFVRPLTAARREDARQQVMDEAVREFVAAAERLGYNLEDAAKAIRAAPRCS
jgi:GntR family transcriptional regulator